MLSFNPTPFPKLNISFAELTSRDHSATSTFLHIARLFQGPGLPPSNAVLPHPVAGEPPLPAHYHRARRGITAFLFRIPLPPSSPSSIDFGNGLARIRYEVRASAGVAWKDQNRLVTDKCPVDILQRYSGDDDATQVGEGDLNFDTWPAPEALIVGEGGKIWVQGRILGGMLVAGESACVELQVKNHSAKKVSPLCSYFSFTLNVAGRRRASISRSLVIYTFRRQRAAPAESYHPHYKSPTLSRASPSVGPNSSLIPAQRVSLTSCSTFRELLAQSQHIRDMVETWMRMTASRALSGEEPPHSSKSAVSSQFG